MTVLPKDPFFVSTSLTMANFVDKTQYMFDKSLNKEMKRHRAEHNLFRATLVRHQRLLYFVADTTSNRAYRAYPQPLFKTIILARLWNPERQLGISTNMKNPDSLLDAGFAPQLRALSPWV